MRIGCNSNMSLVYVNALVILMFPLVRILIMTKHHDAFIVTIVTRAGQNYKLCNCLHCVSVIN